jgi:hypothetical protein
MKKLMLMLVVGVFISNNSFGANDPSLKSELTEKIIIDLSDVELSEDQQESVAVSFYICDGKIEIAEISGTNEAVILKVKQKLSLLKIEAEYDEGSLYRYNLEIDKI